MLKFEECFDTEMTDEEIERLIEDKEYEIQNLQCDIKILKKELRDRESYSFIEAMKSGLK